MKQVIIILIILLTIISFSISQDQSELLIARITTMEYMDSLSLENPAYHDQVKDIEKKNKKFKKKGIKEDYILPVVFHIVQSNGMPEISEEQIFSQIDALNRDYNDIIPVENHPNDKGGKFDNRKEVVSIQFCLPKSNENQPRGIDFTFTDISNWNDFNSIKNSETGGIDQWDPDKYINIWVTALEDQNVGYAQLPGGTETHDGIVIDYRFFGQTGTAEFPYDEGKSLTHLMGSYLGLYPLWGEFQCSDDYVEDTPIHNDANYGCPQFDHITICEGNETEMTMNFMDATYDACRYMFTSGQVNRMQSTISQSGYRSKLSKTQTDCDQEPELTEEEIATRGNKDAEEIQDFIEIRPNPVSDQIYITLNKVVTDTEIEFVVNSISGKSIHQGQVNGTDESNTIDVNGWSPGLYVIIFKVGDKLVSKKIIVQ
jgi:hypothetical protein